MRILSKKDFKKEVHKTDGNITKVYVIKKNVVFFWRFKLFSYWSYQEHYVGGPEHGSVEKIAFKSIEDADKYISAYIKRNNELAREVDTVEII